MLGYQKLKELYKNMDFKSLINLKLHVSDLLILLDIVIKSGCFSYITDTINRISRINNIDIIKLEIIQKYSEDITNGYKRILFESISSDAIKSENLDYMISLLDKKDPEYSLDYELLIEFTISSLKSDKLRAELYRKYVHNFKNIDMFSSYISSIKNPKYKEKEFLYFKKQHRKFNLNKIASSFSNDEQKYNFFTKYFTNSMHDQILPFIRYGFFRSKNDEYLLKTIDTYAHLLSDSELVNSICTIYNETNFVNYVEKYYNRISNCFDYYEFVSKLKSVKNEDNIFSLIGMLVRNGFGNIVCLINNLEDQDLRIKLFDKYKNNIDYDQFWSLMVYLDTDNKKIFIEKYKKYFTSYFFEKIVNFHIFSCDYVLKNYIDYINPQGFKIILSTKLYYSRKDFSLDENLDYLLSLTSNKTTIMNILNGFALIEPERFAYYNYINSKIFTKHERNIIEQLYRDNKNLYNTFVFGLVKIPYLKDNYNFLKRLSLYPEIAISFIDIYSRYHKRYDLLIMLLNHIFESNVNTDELVQSVLDYFSNSLNTYLDEIDFKSITDNQIDLLIYKIYKNRDLLCDDMGIMLDSEFSNIDVNVKSVNTFNNYESIVQSRLTDALNKFNTVEQFKNIVLFSIFGMNIKSAEECVEKFGTSLDKVKDEESLRFILDIKSILSSNTINELSKLLYSIEPLTYKERYISEYKAKQYFNRIISDSLYKVNEKDLYSIKSFHLDNIQIYKPKDYYLLVHSLMAYNSNDGFIGDYNLFWNYNSNVSNHGICCSLISNQNVGQTAPVHNVIFGFDSFHENAINNANNCDIASRSVDYCSTGYSCKFMLPTDYINTTRHTHNEFVLERKELRDNKSSYESIQPSYVIMYDYFDLNHRRLSIRAAYDLNIPIVYIDTHENANREKEILDQYKNHVDSKFDLDELIKYLVRSENNFHGYYHINQECLNNYFSKRETNNYLDSVLKDIYNDCLDGIIDVDVVINFYKKFIDAAESLDTYEAKSQEMEFIHYSKYISKAKKYLKSLTSNESSSYQRKRNK